MAGGRGSRLAPYTTVLPKPLMPIGDRPILEVIMTQLVRAGVERIDISVGHLGSLIESWVAQLANYPAQISLLYEDEPLGTAGALGGLQDVKEPFLAMNGDILTDLDFGELLRAHADSGALATVAIKERAINIEYGIVHPTPDGMLDRLEEKPTLQYMVSMGVYAFDPEVIEHVAEGEHIDFPDLLLRIKDHDHGVRTYPYDGYWRDIGNHDEYEAAIEVFAAHPEKFLGGTS